MNQAEIVRAHVAGGLYRLALPLLPRLQRTESFLEFEVISAEILAATGDPTTAKRLAQRVLQSPAADRSFVARAHLVLAALAQEGFSHRDALSHIENAAGIIPELLDPVLIGNIQLARLASVLDWKSSELMLPILAETKQAVARSADPQLLIGLRLQFARLEAHRRSLFEARRHLVEAGTLLRAFLNPSLAAKQQLGLCVVASLAGELDEASSAAHRAIQLAETSGHERTRRAGIVNLSHVLCACGDYTAALRMVEELLPELTHDVELRVAAFDSLANILINRGSADEARGIISTIHDVIRQRATQSRPRWYELALSETKARVYLAGEDHSSALKAIVESEAAADEDAVWATRLRLLKLEVYAAQYEWDGVSKVLEELDWEELSAEARARIWFALRNSPGDVGRRRAALAGALRYCLFTNRHVQSEGCRKALDELPKPSHRASFAAALDRVAEMITLPGHPQLLAQEVLGVILSADCAEAAAVVGRRAEGVRILASHNFTEDALHANARSRMVIDCGGRDAEQFQVVADLSTGLDARFTAAAIQRIVRTALNQERCRRDEQQRAALWPSTTVDADGEAIWRSDVVRDILAMAHRAASSRATILITGETGTGKEVLARVIHTYSPRSVGPFIAFNCSATPRDMLESQLFGYRKGAFTGADSAFTGVTRAAEGGTLFLDEIGDIPLDLQPKLLRFLENREIHPLGEAHPTRLNVRVVAATNVNLEGLIASGRFREDLFYRLNVVPLHLPPLRERREEIPPLASHFIRRFAAEEGKGNLTLADDALECLLLYRWPGNVRQLANEMNRIVAVAEPGSVITASSLSAEIRRARTSSPMPAAADAAAPATQDGFRLDPDEALPGAVERLERLMVERALTRAGGRVEEAAKLLGISRKGLFLKRRRWGWAGGGDDAGSIES